MAASCEFTIDDEDDLSISLPIDDETTGAIQLVDSVMIPSVTADAVAPQVDGPSTPVIPSSPAAEQHPSPPPLSTTPVVTNATTTQQEAMVHRVTPPPMSHLAGTPLTPPTHQILATATTNNNNTNEANICYHPDVLDIKIRRKRRTAALGVAGGIAGMLLLGPIGGIAVGASAAICTKAALKRKEINKMKQLEKRRALERAMDQAERDAVQREQEDDTVTSTLSDHDSDHPLSSSEFSLDDHQHHGVAFTNPTISA